ncbi:non-ribosomal peptide synthetase [Acetivibrio straminisolvens]|uniref:non-ribosomal peptide synthetase n=1 Tax=Acetivibrio straminisolvens TaxID=253314 RepID=UPI0022403089|nr:non-ribosomal peptide synthetase [Acetivibrio straminisolvens]
MCGYKTLTDMIVSRGSEDKKGITFILSDTEECFVSYKNLYLSALNLLHRLQSAGFKPKDEVIFQIDDNQKFILTFWACILGGMIPVPVTTGTNDEHKLKLFKIWEVLNNPRIIISQEFIGKLEAYAHKNGLSEKMEVIKKRAEFIYDKLDMECYGKIHEAQPDDIAFIQFSSGSTGDPKGVIITHRNVLINLTSVIQWTNMTPNDVGLNWMPLTHDMGLIGTHIKGILAGMNQYNIQTQLFVRHPTLWIQKASEHKATLLYSPNFGYKHFMKFFNPEDKRDWDLSCVRYIFNGAEPISLDICNEFLDKMAPYGLKRQAMYPVYGLAEGTIAVTFPKPGDEIKYSVFNRNNLGIGDTIAETVRDDTNGVTFVDVGYPIYNCSVRICDKNNADLGENRIGYIQIRGGNVTCGYYNNEAATKEAITDDGWLNTGDLGLLRDGRLIITGRAKDVIFMAGQNYYSHDIERVAESVDGIELGKIVATGVYNQSTKCDELVLFVLFKQKLENFVSLALQLKSTINRTMGIEVSEVIPVKNIPKTTSGKVQRYKLRNSFINGEFDKIRSELAVLMDNERSSRKIDLPKNPIEKKLVAIWSDLLELENVGTRDDFFELGGDSLKATQLISRIKEFFGVGIEQTEILENSDIAGLAEVIEKHKNKGSKEHDAIVRASENTDNLPLSFSQKRLWFLDRLSEKSTQYNLYTALKLRGNLDRKSLQKSLDEIMDRHRILKMAFREENGQPVQVYNPEAKLDMVFVDLRQVPEEERERQALEIARKEAAKPFELGKAPLLRASLLCLDNDEHILVMVVHHIVFDGWSFGIFLKEMTHYYEMFRSGKGQKLEELSIQYTDYAYWQAKRFDEGLVNNQLEYWKNKLSGDIPVLDLPLDKQRPAIQTYNGAKFTASIPSDLVKKLKKLAGKEKSTLFMVLLAAFKALLYRYTGQEDIVVGTPIANRNRKDIENLIGFFTNNLVMRTRFSGKTSFLELLRQVRRTTLDAYSNQDVPFEKLVEELHVERDMSRNPLFQVLFSLQNTHISLEGFSEINASIIGIDNGSARFDLALDIREAGDGLKADFEYNTDLLNQDTIKRMAGHYRQLLDSIVQSPEKEVDMLSILTREEKTTMLNTWNSTEVDYGDIPCWTKLFEEQVKKKPHRVAVRDKERCLTYAELNSSANRLANYLISKGVGPEIVVGVYLDRTVNMLIALLGIHKAGGAYLPMDPIFPKDRLMYMQEDAKVEIILSESALEGTLPQKDFQVICLDREGKTISQYSDENPETKNNGENLAYLIYTSGSTGKPKGVQIEHHALINFLLSMADKTGIKEDGTLLAVTTLSFDIAGLEMFMPLVSGAGIVIAGRDEVIDGRKLIELLDENFVSIMQATPATWRLMIEEGWEGNKGLTVLCGGEALSKELAKQLLDRCGTLLNVYGPTETTIWSTIAKVEHDTDKITIGKPIANTQVYVLDENMNPVPAGIPGELYIGGDGLARGYLNQPHLTEEKFIKDPFRNKDGARLYKTGDMVKFLSDGNLEFIGRNDHQVKIRGFRIELGEIENLLNGFDNVRQSVVVAKEIAPGEKSLVAYIIPTDEKAALSSDALRKKLKERLPDYMVPAAFVMMDSFSMTPNGKIDRKALPMPENLRPQLKNEYMAPRSEIEKTIVSIWQEVLKLEHIGINDNFFDLGGHSLLLAQVRSKISAALKKEITMIDLFRYPTIKTLSEFLEGKQDLEHKVKQDKKGIDGKGDIAVVGLSGRFPGAKNIEEFWQNLCNGVESVKQFTDEEVIGEGVDPNALKKPEYVKAWGVLDNVDKFDAAFFGYNPREAEVLDPQQRIFLEEAWKALENAGYDAQKYPGKIGVYASVGMNTYTQNLAESFKEKGLASDYQIMISNDKDFLATRVAYKLNLKGPAVTVQTACSSSLVAVHLACLSLQNGECDMAVAGGASIRLPQKTGYLYQEGMILSPDGHCRAFDEEAKGTVGGNGAGVVVLKRLEDAICDGDSIWAVIKGTAINNDGSVKVGYTAPGIEGQAGAISEAHLKAGVDPETITYIEAHGTGTPLGDPIEIEALKQVFGKTTQKKGFCAIGSVKTNIGHLDAAAGVSGLIKTVLALKNKIIPPSLNFKKPNPKLNIHDSPFYINNSLKEWKSNIGPLRAGVSSFGIGGTNAHAVLEEAPVVDSDICKNDETLLVFSAKTRSALDKMTYEFVDFLKKNSDINMADAAYTLQLGRKEMEHRRFVVCKSREDAIYALENIDSIPKRVFDSIEGQNGEERFMEVNPKDYTLEQLGHLWLKGAKIDWGVLYEGTKRRRIPLPSYPFEGKSYWVDGVKKNKEAEVRGKISDISKWFYAPVWKQSAKGGLSKSTKYVNANDVILILTKDSSFCDSLIKRVKHSNENIIVAKAGESFGKMGDRDFLFRPEQKEDYDSLLKEISKLSNKPDIVLNLLGVTEDGSNTEDTNGVRCGKQLFYSLVYLAQAFGNQGWNTPVQFKVFTDNTFKLFNEKTLYYGKTLAVGPCKVIPREYPNIRCSIVDFELQHGESLQQHDIIECFVSEIYEKDTELITAYRGLERWIQTFDGTQVEESPDSLLKKNGVYLITGGLGGIGLNLAEYLAKEVQAKLILVSRSEFPEMDKWQDWLLEYGKNDSISRKINKLGTLQNLGSEIMVCKADVTDTKQLEVIRHNALNRFGRIDGIIHAAGNPGGGMIQMKTKEFCENVLAPKVDGTLALYETFMSSELDFFIFCSSLNAITGGFGQVDYGAANVFLDSFAKAHDSYRGTRFISINWDRWPGVGMAGGTGQKIDEGEPAVHPLLGKKVLATSEKKVYLAEFSPSKDWVLSEHLVMGIPTIAGTTYLEMARAAYKEMTSKDSMQISDVIFLTPMVVRQDEAREVFTILTKSGNEYDFQVASKLKGAKEEAIWHEHVRGKIKPLEEENAKQFDLEEIKARCFSKMEISKAQGDKTKEFISFGDRWKSLKGFDLGENEGLVEVELADEFIGDLKDYELHPALLDVATGSVRLASGGNFLPFSYEKLTIDRPLPGKIYGFIRFKNGYSAKQDIITCDIDIMNDKGEQIVEICNFSMRLTDDDAAKNIRERISGQQKIGKTAFDDLYKIAVKKESGFLNNGISESEGKEVFRRIVNGLCKSQIIVSVKDLNTAIEQANYINQQGMKKEAYEKDSRPKHPRPELDNDYVPPKNDIEQKLADIWQETLNIEAVGIHDEFFALGGDSLLLIQLHSKIKESFSTGLAVVDLYKYNTIASLAKYLSSENKEEEQPVFQSVSERSNRQLEAMKQKRQEMKLKRQQMKQIRGVVKVD